MYVKLAPKRVQNFSIVCAAFVQLCAVNIIVCAITRNELINYFDWGGQIDASPPSVQKCKSLFTNCLCCVCAVMCY